MRIIYLMTAPPPALEGTDAVLQEAEVLRAHFGGAVVHTALSSRPWTRVPRALYGLQRLWPLKRLERDADLFHIYHAELFAFPILRLLRKPIVYSVASGLGARRLPDMEFLQRLGAIVVPSRRDLSRLRDHGLTHGHLVSAGIDVSRFSVEPVPAGDPFVLMSGSAPWTAEQFHTKGVDALLEVVEHMPFVRLVMPWRGWLLEELRRRVAVRGLKGRVEVLAERVDMNEVLSRAHAAVVLASEPKLVKAFPHSLLEALACGRPVVVSEGIALAEYVEQTGCGLVVKGVEPGDLANGIRRLRQDYSWFQSNALRVGRRDFCVDRLVEDYRRIYSTVVAAKPDGSRV